jgi:hypothetical protein
MSSFEARGRRVSNSAVLYAGFPYLGKARTLRRGAEPLHAPLGTLCRVAYKCERGRRSGRRAEMGRSAYG